MVRYLRLLQAVEHHPAAFYGCCSGAPDLVDALFCRRIRGVPPAIDGLHNGVAIVPLLRQTIGVLPAAAEDEVIAFPPHVGFTVEVPQQKGGLFCARCLRQRFPLGSKRLLFVLPPAHVHRIIPDVSCTAGFRLR